MEILRVEKVIDDLCEELDLAEKNKDGKKAKEICIKLLSIMEELKQDTIQIKTVH